MAEKYIISPPIKKRRGHYCCVVQCHSQQGRENCSFFHCVRQDQAQSEAWSLAINRQNPDKSLWIPTPASLICGLHFVTGQASKDPKCPDYVPTIFPTSHVEPKTAADLDRFYRLIHRRTYDKKDDDNDPLACGFDSTHAMSQVDSSPQTATKNADHIATKSIGTTTERIPASRVYTERVLSSGMKCKSTCGISRPFFKQTMMSLEGKFMTCHVMADQDQLVLYFMKLKTKLPFLVLATIFDVDHSTVSKSFMHTLKAHYKVAKKYMWWFTKSEVQCTMPDIFKLHYPDTRVIIGASEIKIQSSNRTAKFLVAIAPCGLISFISRAYGGHVTDTDLTTECGILDLLKPGDRIMSATGFPHIQEDVLGRGVFLVKPPLQRECYNASVRFHVETAISRLKTFGVLQLLEPSLYKHINMILVVVAYTINNFGPLICDDDQEEEGKDNDEDANAMII